MTLEELKKELETDLPINLTDLQWEAANNPVLYGKWLRYMSVYQIQSKKYMNEKVKAQRKTLDFYTGRGDDISVDHYDKTELRTIIPSEKEVMEADTKMEVSEIMVGFCKEALNAIKQRGFSIKAIIEQRQLEAGK